MTDAILADIVRHCAAPPPGESTPKYLRLMKAVENAIADGRLRPGDRLPTEADLAGAVPYSLGTVQKALGGLVRRGILNRTRRSGTFVADAPRPLDDLSRFTFERADGSRVDEILTRVVDCLPTAENGRWSAVLGPCAAGFIRILRLDEIDGAFACCSETYLPADRFPQLLAEPLDALSGLNLRPLLARRYGAITASLGFAVRAAGLPRHAAGLLGLPPGTSGLELEITGRNAEGEALFLQTLRIPANDYRVRIVDGGS